MITQRFAVEFDRRTVGIAVRVPGGFIFFASDDRFNEMDGRLFQRARAIEQQLKRVANGSPRNTPTLQPNQNTAELRPGTAPIQSIRSVS